MVLRKEELQIGDWVFVNPNVFIEDEYEPYKDFSPCQILSGEDIDLAIEDCYHPIEITSEILRNNGFSYTGGGTLEWTDGPNTIKYDGVKVYVYGQEYELVLQIQYVHQLQHIIRLLNVREDIILVDILPPLKQVGFLG